MTICDFCTAAGPPWEYPAREVELPGGTLSIGPWLACDACSELIEADDYEALARRAEAARPELPIEVYREAQRRFQDSRTGRARPVRMTPMHGRVFER